MIELLARIIDAPQKDKALEDFRRATFLTVESLAKQSKLLNLNHEVFLNKLIPAIASKIDSK
jgi:hypothetical protein